MGVLIEGAQAHPGRTAYQHLRVLATERSVDTARIDEALERVHLTGAGVKKLRGFSLGMRQRLDLAAAMLGEPEILILDEPANGLDPAGVRWLREFLRSFAAAGGTVFVSSHQLAETSQLADDVIVIDRGRLVAHTSVRELTAESIVRVRTPRSMSSRHVSRRSGAMSVGAARTHSSCPGLPMEKVGRVAADASIELHELTTRTSTLEDVFLALTNDGEDR